MPRRAGLILEIIRKTMLMAMLFRVKREEQINQLKDELKHIGSDILQWCLTLNPPPFSVSKKAFSFSWFSVLCPLLHCPPIRHKREGSIKEFSKDLSQLGTHIKNWLGDKDTHHCKIFWSRGGNKGYGGGEQLVEEEDREGQVQLQHHPQQVRQHTQPLTWRAGTWESPVWISTSARSVSTSVKITLQVFYTPPPLFVQVTFSADKYFLYCLPCLQQTKMFVA